MADLDIKKSKKELLKEIAELKMRLDDAGHEKAAKIDDKFALVYASMSDGLALHDIIYNSSGKAIDYYISEVNPSFERITGLLKNEILGKKASVVYGVEEAPYLEVYSKVASTGQPVSFETYFPPMNKHFHVSVFSPSKGMFATVFQDITERKLDEENIKKLSLVQENLRESEERYHQMFGQHQAIGLLIDPETGAIIDANPAAIKYYGYTYEQLCSLHIQDINQLPPNEVEAERKKALTEQRNYFVFPHRLANGEIRWVEVYSSPLSHNGRQLLYSLIHDITSRRNAEELLRVSEERFSLAFKSSPNAITITRLSDGKIIDGNDSVYSLLGYTHEEVVGKTTTQLGIWTNSTDRLKLTGALASKGSVHNEEFLLNKKDGTQVPVNLSASLITIDNERCFICSFIDLTERKEAEKALKKSEERFKLALRNAPVGIAIQDRDLIYTWAYNQKSRRPEEIIGKTDADLFAPEDLEWINPLKANILETGKEMNVEKWLTTNGQRYFLGIHFEPIFDSSGVIKGIGAATIDLTTRKLAEEAFAFQSRLLADVHDAVFSSDSNFILTYWNKAAERLFGWTAEEALGKNSGELLKPKVENSSRGHERSKLRNAGHWEGEVQYIRKDGTYFFVDVNSSVLKDTVGKDIGNVVVCRDITARKLAEEALKKSERRYSSLFANKINGMSHCRTITDDKGRPVDYIIVQINDAYERIIGIKKADIEGRKVTEVFPDIKNYALDYIGMYGKIALEGGEIKFEELFEATGQILSIYAYSPVPGEFIAIFTDVTERKLMEEKLRESENKFRNLVKNAPTAIYELDFKTRKFMSVNDAMCELSGYSREELLSIDSLELLEEESRNLFLSRIHQTLKGEKPDENVEYKVKSKDGRLIDAVLNMKFKFDEKGIPVGALVVGHDITQRKHTAEELQKVADALKESEIRFRTLSENIPDMIVRFDRNLRLSYCNEAVLKRTGLSREFLFGKTATEYGSSSESAGNWERVAREVLATGESRRIEQANVWQDKPMIYDSLLVPEKDDSGNVTSLIAIARDITEMKRTREMLLKSRERYKELVTNARSMILKFDNDANFTFINSYALEFFGYRREELLGKSVMVVVPKTESTGRNLDEMVENITEDPDKYSININENIKKNGEKVWVEWHNKTLFDKNGRKNGHIAIGIDITKRRKAQEDLKESEQKLRSVLNATLESIYLFDREGNFCMANSTGLQRLKLTSETELTGHHFSEFMSAETARNRQAMFDKVLASGSTLEVEDEREKRIYYHNFSPVLKDDKVEFIVTFSTDITDRRKADELIRESEDRLRTIAESLPVIISITRVSDSIMTFVNQPYLNTFRVSRDEIIGKPFPDIFGNPKDIVKVNELLKESGFVDNMQLRVKKTDGTQFWILTSIRKIVYMGETSFLASSIDISKTKKAEEELLRLNRTLNAQRKSSQIMMHSKSEVYYLNQACKIIIEDCGYAMVWVGYAIDDADKNVIPQAYYGFDIGYIEQMKIRWDNSSRGNGPTGRSIKTGKPVICRNMLTDPTFKPWRESALKRGYASSLVLPLVLNGKSFGAISIYSKEPDPFTKTEIDLLGDLADDLAYGISFIRLTESERESAIAIKESESKLRELIVTKDKFFNIVAHDLKNPFTSLLGSSELLYENINNMTSENVRKLALILNNSAKGGYAILQNLLDWSRSQTGLLKINPETLNMRLIVNENIDNFQLQVTSKSIDLKSELTEDLFIMADKNMINTVLRNLLSNAVKYTYKNGVVAVKASCNPEEVIVIVSDSGIGMPKEKVDSLFRIENTLSQPGTEKEQGTGLGLKLCKEFAERMGGRIWVESKVGKGSEFKFTIPNTLS